MSKKLLTGVIAVLCLVIVWQWWGGERWKPGVIEESLDKSTTTKSELSTSTSGQISTASIVETATLEEEQASVEGLYVGLRDEIGGSFDSNAMYMLLDDGTEIISISLASLVGTQKTGVEAVLGIKRGDRLLLEGNIVDGLFEATSVTVID